MAENLSDAPMEHPSGGVPERSVFDPLPKITNEGEYGVLPAGAEYLDPTGATRKKPFTVRDTRSYEAVPEGESYVDPSGQTRKKPAYEGINFTTQTLYDMTVTPKEKRRVLEQAYPGKVKETAGAKDDFYVEDDDGVLRKPGRGSLAKRVGAAGLGMAAPVTGSVLGAIGGGVAAAPTGPGAVAGAAAGGAAGGMLGQGFNDLVLRLAGVDDRSVVEEFAHLGLSGLTGAAGAGVGRGIGAVAPAIKGWAQAGSQAAPRAVASVLGADAERLATAKRLADEGVKTPPSAVFMEAPYLHTAVEVFDPKFRTQNVLRQSAEDYYERKGGEVLDKAGVGKDVRPVKLADPEAAVSSERAGAAVLARASEEMSRQDAALAAATAKVREQAAAGMGEKSTAYQASLEELRKAEQASRAAVQDAIDVGFKSIQSDIDTAVKAAKVGVNSGEMWDAVAKKFQGVRAGVMQRARVMYDAADTAAGTARPNIEGLPGIADDFMKSLPDTFKAKHPDIVARIGKLATEEGVADVTFGQLRNVRSYLRSNVDYHDLTPDQREGAFKYFANKVNAILHDPNAPSELKTASKMLDEADKFYGENMKVFKDKNIQAVVRGLEAGMPADPKLLAETILKEGRSDLINKVKEMVGPNLWSAVRAADTQEMLDAAKTLVPGQIDGRAFANQVLDRVRRGTLDAIYEPAMAEKLRTQAQHIAINDGKLPLTARPGDTVVSLIEQAKAATDAVKAQAKTDPLGTLRKEMQGIEREHQKQIAALRNTRKSDPLGFLYDKTMGASEAADRILGDKDLIFAAASKFGESSPEFQMLRQVYAQRVLQGTMSPSGRLEKITPEIQRIMFPGASLDEMKTLARNMDFLMGAKAMSEDAAGASIAAQSRVLNPWGSITGLGKFAKPLKVVPGMETVGRFILTKYYKLLSDVVTSPATLQWIARGLEGGPIEREAVRAAVQRGMKNGQWVGAGVGESLYQVPREPERRRAR